jgi:hypothetical protein
VKTYHSFCLELLESHGRLFTGEPLRVLYPRPERLRKSQHGGNWEVHRLELRKQGKLCFDLFARRIEHLTEATSSKVFDLGRENHRSPTAGILAFADAVLRNRSPLPRSDDVLNLRYNANMLRETLHAAPVWTFSKLRKMGVEDSRHSLSKESLGSMLEWPNDEARIGLARTFRSIASFYLDQKCRASL